MSNKRQKIGFDDVMLSHESTKRNEVEILKIKLDFLTRDLEKTSDIINQIQQEDIPSTLCLFTSKSEKKDLNEIIKDKKINAKELKKRRNQVSDEIQSLQREIKKLGEISKRIAIVYLLPVLFISSFSVLLMSGVFFTDQPQRFSSVSHFVIENLRGDTIDTWIAWNLVEEDLFHVHVKNSKHVTEERIEAIYETIMSEQSIELDDSLLHKGPTGSFSTYYLGWYGALNSINEETESPIPKNLHFDVSDRGEGHVIIELTNLTNLDGYSGFTKSITDESNHQLTKSTITIYDVENLSIQQLKTILRHELGHAFGLAHSTAPEDLMAPQITTNYPYISDCDLDAITLLYDGGESSQVICEK